MRMADTTKPESDKTERLKAGQRIALMSTLVLFCLAVLKAIVGYRYHSFLLVADAYHSGADILINFTSLLGLWLASKKKSTRFPYGLYRAETVACILIGGVILHVGFDIFNEGLEKLFLRQRHEHFPLFPVGAAVISCLVSWFLAVKQKSVGKSIGSQALLATAREAFYDIFTSLFVLAGILLVYAGIPFVEGGIIIVISVFILTLGIKTVGTSLMILMDANMDMDLRDEIEEKINRMYGVKGVGDVKIRSSGPFKMVECVIETSPNVSIYRAHEMADQTEKVLLNDYDHIESVFIHVEPENRKDIAAVIPVENIDGLNATLHGHFGRAPYYMIVHLKGENIEIEDFYLNEFLGKNAHIGLNVVKKMISYRIDVLFVSKIGEIAFHMLKNNFVDIYQADEGVTVHDIVKRYHKKALVPLTNPTHSTESSHFSRSKNPGIPKT
jgi:cation diffusion facilitator family transporter